jgi:glutamate:Na+ symporter, ESS family
LAPTLLDHPIHRVIEVGSPTLLALGMVAVAIGMALCRVFRILDRLSMPAPVIGGLTLSLVGLALWYAGITLEFDAVLRNALMLAFFTTVGLSARFELIRKGGPALALLLVLSALGAVLQNVLGMAVARGMGVHPLLGIIAGSVTLTGGPATGLAFGPTFERLGVPGASAFALASATLGIVAGGLLGGPLATLLIRRHGLAPGAAVPVSPYVTAQEARGLMREGLVVLLAMSAGTLLSEWISAHGVILPSYIGAMLVAAAFRNATDAARVLPLSSAGIERIGTVTLNLFIGMALVGLRLWELRGLAAPLAAILAVQVAVLLLLTYSVVYRMMGRDYQSAVIAGGFVGYMLGITPNAVANMEALVEKYGPAPRAYLIVPLVAAFLIDFANSVIITHMTQWTTAMASR